MHPTGPTPASRRHRLAWACVLVSMGTALLASIGIALAVGSASAVEAGQQVVLRGGAGGGSPSPRPPGKCSTPSNEVVREVPWTHQRLGIPRVWELTTGKGVTVGVVDTGVDAWVPQLVGHVLQGTDVVNGAGTADDDCFGHGTFVAGIIAAQPRAGTGFAGVAPGVKILPIRQANGTNDGTASGLARSIRAAADMGATVVNVSASAFFPSEELRSAVEYAASKDVVLVAAASNEAQSGNPKAYPAAYPSVIAVGSVGRDGQRSQFSETGDFLDLMAPGVDIISLSRAGQGHLTDNGTSYATPFVTATAALVRAYHPELSAAQVKRRLELTADHPGGTVPDPEMGWGVVNPYNAVSAILPEENGVRGVPSELKGISPIRDPKPDTSARDTAVLFAGGAGGIAVAVGLMAHLMPRGTRRRWRAADEPDGGGDADPASRGGRHRATDRDGGWGGGGASAPLIRARSRA